MFQRAAGPVGEPLTDGWRRRLRAPPTRAPHGDEATNRTACSARGGDRVASGNRRTCCRTAPTGRGNRRRGARPAASVPVLMYHVDRRAAAARRRSRASTSRAVELGRRCDGLRARATQAVDARPRRRLPGTAGDASSATDRPQSSRRRLPELRHRGARRSSRARLADGVLNLDLSNLAPALGDRPRERRPSADRRRLGDRRPLDDARRPCGRRRCALRREVAGSRQAIRRLFGITPRFFCYADGPLRRRDDRGRRGRPGTRARRRPRSGSRRRPPAASRSPGSGRPRRRRRRSRRGSSRRSDCRRDPDARGGGGQPERSPAYALPPSWVSPRPVASEPRPRQRAQLVEVAAELADVAPDDAALLARDDRARVGLGTPPP